MFKNYLTVALRNLTKHRFFSGINIFGLTVGIASCLLIFIYVTDELGYDRFHTNVENIYRVGLHGKIAGQEIYTNNSSFPVGPTMKSEIPGVESMTRLRPIRGSGVLFKNEEKIFTEKNIMYADSNFFKFFSFKLLEGDKETVLNEPNSIVITPTLAKKYFNGPAVGKTLVIGNDKKAFKVTGIAEEAPSGSHFHFSGVLSYNTISRDSNQVFQGWTSNSMYTYITKSPLTKPEEINAKLEDLVAKYVGKELEKGLGINFDEFRKQGGIYSYIIYPLTDSHLKNFAQDDIEPSGDMKYVYIFSGVGIFILLLACINFMNLATAQSAGRAKEVGLRKTLGSLRSQLMGQFLSESFIFSFVAVVLAIGLCYMLLPYFNLLSGKQLTLAAISSPSFFIAALLLTLVVGFLAGSYPAFYLTSFNVTEVIKGKVRAGMKSKGVRSTLVVFQFAVSILLILATAVVFLQLTHMQEKDLGMDKHNVLVIQSTSRLEKNRMAFRNEVKNLAGVSAVSFCANSFPGVNNTTVFREKGSSIDHLTGKYSADWDHFELMKFKLASGRYFSRDFTADSTNCVVNKAFVKEFGWADDNAINQEVIDFNGSKPETVKVIGVVEDFNFETLKDKVRPMIIRLERESRNLMVRYEGNPQQVVSGIEKIWKENAASEPFEFTFLDQDFDTLFHAEQRLRDIFTVFSFLAISIACLGLFALAAFTTEQRTKEIGIRKAMGASVTGLTIHLSKEFMILVLIAIVPAIGLGWYLADRWLSDFPYRITLTPSLFIGSALVAIVIAWLTVSYQSLKAANAKPINSLRYE